MASSLFVARFFLVGLLCSAGSCEASWESYIYDSLVGSGYATKGAILGMNGAIWTPADGEKILNISQAEASTIASAMRNKDLSVFLSSGVTIGGVKYTFLRVDNHHEGIIVAREERHGTIALGSSAQAIVIGLEPEGKGGWLLDGVAHIVRYLKAIKY